MIRTFGSLLLLVALVLALVLEGPHPLRLLKTMLVGSGYRIKPDQVESGYRVGRRMILPIPTRKGEPVSGSAAVTPSMDMRGGASLERSIPGIEPILPVPIPIPNPVFREGPGVINQDLFRSPFPTGTPVTPTTRKQK
jgi:hypothetical protein